MISLTINGQSRQVECPPDMPLLWVLRDVVGSDRHQVRLRHRAVRRLHRALSTAKPVRSCLLPVGIDRRPGDHHHRGASARRRTARRCSRRGWTSKWSSAATASRARSCRRRRCSTRSRIPTTPTSTRRWRATSAAAAPMCESGRRSSTPRRRPDRHARALAPTPRSPAADLLGMSARHAFVLRLLGAAAAAGPARG